MITITLLSLHVDAWSVTAGEKAWPGSFLRVTFWGDNIPSTVNVQLAAQNPDKTFTTVGQTDYNISPGSYQVFNTNGDSPVGLNYFIVAVDVNDPKNFAVSNPITLYDPFGNAHPTNSVTATGTLVYKTLESSSIATPSSTLISASTNSFSGSSTSTSTNTATATSSKTSDNDSHSHSLPTSQIVVIAVMSCVGAVLIAVTCFKIIIVSTFQKRSSFDLHSVDKFSQLLVVERVSSIITLKLHLLSEKKPILLKSTN